MTHTENPKETLYVYVRSKNKKFIERLAKKNNLPMSRCIDLALDSLRTNTEFKLDTGKRTPKQ